MARQRVTPVFAAACLFVVSGQSTAAAQTITVGELAAQALQRNRDLLAARERIAEAQGLLRQAGLRLAPSIEVEGGTGRPLGTRGEEEYSAAFFYPFETGGKRQKRVAAARISVSLAEAEVAERMRQLTFEVKRRAAEVISALRKKEATKRLLDVGRGSYTVTKARVDEGDAAPLEQQLLATDLARVEVQLTTFEGRATAAALELQQVLGTVMEYSDVKDDSSPIGDLPLQELVTRAQTSRPDLKAARLLEEHAAAEVELARAQGQPDITAAARYIRRNSFFDDQFALSPAGVPIQLRDRDNVVAVGVAIPLFTQRRNQGNVAAAVARQNAARLRREYLENTIPLEVEATYNRWKAARQTLSMFERGVVEQSEKNLDIVRQAYTLGQLRVLDVLTEQRRLIETRLAYVDAQAELMQSTAELERAVGAKLQ